MASSHRLTLLKKELRQSFRGYAALLVENLSLLAICLVALIAAVSAAASAEVPWRVGGTAFWTVALALSVIVGIIIPAAAASLLTTEHEQKTFDTLRVAPITARQIVGGKLAGAIVVHGTVLVVAVPVAAACFLLGGVSVGAAISALVVLGGALVYGAALGLASSATVQRTAGAVPLAAALALGLVLAPAGLVNSAPAVSAISPLAAMIVLSHSPVVPLFHGALPVWLLCLVFWAAGTASLLAGTVQRLEPRSLQRFWPARWRELLFAALLLLAVMGSLHELGQPPNAVPLGGLSAASRSSVDQIPMTLTGVVGTTGYVLLFLTVAFSAGLLTPLDRRRLRGEATPDHRLGERLFGLSLDSGARYGLLLAVMACGVLELGLALWGGKVSATWRGPLLLSFLPMVSAVWAVGVGARLLAFRRRPYTDMGRRALAIFGLILLIALSILPTVTLSHGHEDPTFAMELTSLLILGGGVETAFPCAHPAFDTPRMTALMAHVPGPVLTALVHLLVGVGFLLLLYRARRAWRRRENPPAAMPTPAAGP